jgi:hypothetical protein
MKATALIFAAGLCVTVFLAGGCFQVQAPESINVGTPRPAPSTPSSVPPPVAPAQPGNYADMQRENAQLRQQNEQLRLQVRDLSDNYSRAYNKVNSLEKDKQELKDKVKRVEGERDEYKKQRDQYWKAMNR